MRPQIDSVTAEFSDGTVREFIWEEEDYDWEDGEWFREPDNTQGVWMVEVYNHDEGAYDYREAEEWELKAVGLWREPHVDEPLSQANWEGEGA